jgi:hypothetical protein
MAKTPFIRPLQVQGGTFYTFSSAAEDLALTFNNTVNKFRFSKYVLLNLPEFREPLYGENTILFNTLDSSFLDVAEGSFDLVDPNNLSPNLEVSFQNYCLNLEARLLSDDNYNPTLKRNVSERVFWKWLKELGAIRFRPANSNEVIPTLDQNYTGLSGGFPYSEKRWTEEDDYSIGNGSATPRYSRVVKYIGECDIVNSVQHKNNSYSEVYIHVPTGDGHTPLVMFKTKADENYYPGQILTHNPNDPLDTEYLQGRNHTTGLYGPNGLPMLAIFDQDVIGQPGVTGTDSAGTQFTSQWYYPRNVSNSYYTDSSFFSAETDTMTKYLKNGTYEVSYKRNRLDGIQLDFNADNYKPIVDNPSISTIDEFNGTMDSASFEFNTVLIYYDVYDPNNPSDSETNLYGILFLEDIEPISNSAGKIPTFKKYKPDPITKLNGNSYGLKVNIKFDTDVDNTGVELAVNDYSSFSLSMFMDAANVLQEASRTLNDQSLEMINVANRVTVLEDLVVTMDDNTSIAARLSALENAMVANQALFRNTQDILGLIERNYSLTNDLLNGRTNIKLSYDLDLIKSGSGINVDRSVQNRLILNNTVQHYNIPEDTSYGFTINETSGNTLVLSPFNNYFKHSNFGLTITLTNDVIIRIDDTNNQWKKGQTLRLVFDDKVVLAGNNILIYTDTKGVYPLSSPSGVAYSILVGGFTQSIFDSAGNKPIFDIVCVDEKNLAFEIDQIR